MSDPRHKTVKFGALRIGETVKRTVPIVNQSLTAISFQLALTPACLALQERGVLRLSPSEPITLQAKGGTADVEISLTPATRVTSFSEEV